MAAFLLPALYSTLSKLWVANIDSKSVVTTDVYTYIGVIVEVLNEGLPRSAWLIIGDKTTRTLSSRLGLSYTLIAAQMVLGLLMTIIFLAASNNVAAAFVPEQVRKDSIDYVRISSVQAFSSAIETAVSSCTRALDHPDVPLVISSVKFAVNILLDLLLISKFHVAAVQPTVNIQALIRLACDMTAALCGLLYFLTTAFKLQRGANIPLGDRARPSLRALVLLARPSAYTFVESAQRNAVYLWLVSRIVTLGDVYATAWGVFNTIRWGLVMVPVQALEASTLAFVGHEWGRWHARVGIDIRRPKASKGDLLGIVQPALKSCIIGLVVEVAICIGLSLSRGIEDFAYYLSGSASVASATQTMWKSIDWTYIFYALNYQLAAVLLAASPRWYLYQALGSNLLWSMPWAVAMTVRSFPESVAWTYYAIVFGGALVFSFVVVGIVLSVWAFRLMRGEVRVGAVQKSI